MEQDTSVFIGKKGVMSYVLAVVTQFNTGAREVTVKARGKAISKAVDVAEIVKHRFMSELQVKNVSIGTEKMEEGDNGRVSAIEIILSK